MIQLAVALTLLASPQGVPYPPATPEEVGLSSEALEGLAETVRGYHEDGWIVGAELLVVKDRRTVLHEVVGWRHQKDEVPMTRNTVFNIRSMTKPLTGAAIQMLIDDGELAVDDLVADHLDAFDRDGSDRITVKHLLTHRSGLPLTMVTERIDQFDSLFDMATAAAEHGPEREPGSRYWYSDAGTDVLGALVEEVSGQGLDDFVQERLLDPLGMSASFYDTDPDASRRDGMASAYLGRRNAWEAFYDPRDGALYPFPWGSQSLYSTAVDYAKFLALWMDDGKAGDDVLLSEEAIRRTLTPESPAAMMGSEAIMPTAFSGLHAYYGQMALIYAAGAEGDDARPVVVGHSGSDGTWAWGWPERDLMILYFTQSRGQASGLRLERIIDSLLIHPERAADVPEEFRALVGEYVANFGGFDDETFTVYEQDGGLVLDIPSQIPVPLLPPDEDGWWRFSVNPSERLSFVRDDDGVVTALTLSPEGSTRTFEVPRKQG